MFTRQMWLTILGLVAALAVVTGNSAASAATCEGCAPWWHVTVGARPSLLPAGTSRREVQELITTPGEFSGKQITNFSMRVGEAHPLGEFATEGLFGAPEPTAANIEKALETVYGVGSVSVTEEPDALLGSGAVRYVITGGAAAVTPVEVFGEIGTATASVLTVGQSSGEVAIIASNLGDATVNAEEKPVTITSKLPEGVQAVGYEAIAIETAGGVEVRNAVECQLQTPGEPETTTCTFGGTTEINGQVVPRTLTPYSKVEVRLTVTVEEGVGTGQSDLVTVAGGGARGSASEQYPVKIAQVPGEKAPFGLESYEVTPEEPGGVLDRQAGSHPFQTTFTVGLTMGPPFAGLSGEPEAEPTGLIKDFAAKLPPGLIGNPTPFARCTLSEFEAKICPADTVIGVASTVVNEPAVTGLKTNLVSPVFNLEPSVGEPARFGFLPTRETPIFLDTSLRSGGDYGINTESTNIVQDVGLLSSQVTIWGVPGDVRHDRSRGLECLEALPECTPLDETKPPPFLALPTSCTGHPLESVAEVDSWEEPGKFSQASTKQAAIGMPTLVGCERLPFEPQVKITPDGTAGSTATGMNADIHVPQEAILNGQGLAQSAVKDITVALPEGVALNPSDADGLEACSEGLVGFEGFNEFDPGTEPGVLSPAFTPKLPGSNGSSVPLEPGINFCSDASKVGTVRLKTPLLPNPLEGAVYLAAQEANPFGSVVAMYIVAEDPISGSLVKLPGSVSLSPSGQIVATFENTPQVAFEDAEVHFFGGERAPLATPASCGAYTTHASFVPWAANASDVEQLTVRSSSTFNVTSGPHGSPCPGPTLPFSPSLTAGTVNNEAGAFSPFTMTMSREDGQQHLQAVELKMPPGVSGKLAGVELCPEPQASEGTCGPGSLIGETTVSVGVGGDPFSVKGGRVYLTGPYEGAPFGLSIVNPAKAGPFDLAKTKANHPACDCVLVRAKIQVDPITAALTVTSDNTGQFKIPTIIEGVPLQIQHVNVTINRPDFTFNPTNCNPLAITGALSSSEGATEALNVPLQAANCAVLKFTPKISVSTAGKASKRFGVSLHFKISYPANSMGSQAWFQEAKFDLPKQLPARLETLQQACLAEVFEANRTNCPSASKIGTAVVHTPVLPVPLTGPVYFVSYGGAKFPEAVLVLQGYGITVDLHGQTFINHKTGITSATFHSTPDVPFESIEVNLPAGRFSEFGAVLPAKDHYNLCGQKLVLPTFFKAQNGLEIHQKAKIAVTGCKSHHASGKSSAATKKKKKTHEKIKGHKK